MPIHDFFPIIFFQVKSVGVLELQLLPIYRAETSILWVVPISSRGTKLFSGQLISAD
tara:strand:- start:377 stop:547 length:171 start_codon:yes stop_codon:yes gene_type:complete